MLIDTYAFFWTAHPGFDVPEHVRTAWQHADGLWVSDISAYEVAQKVRLGKFADAGVLVDRWMETLERLRGRALPVTTAHALAGGRLAWAHRDPFDRLLAGQALTEGLTILTADPAFDSAPGVDVLRW